MRLIISHRDGLGHHQMVKLGDYVRSIKTNKIGKNYQNDKRRFRLLL